MQIPAQHFAEIVESFKAIEASSNASDKRRYSRFAVVAKVSVLAHATGRAYAALTRDVSLEGLGLMQSLPMKQGEQFSVALSRLKVSTLHAWRGSAGRPADQSSAAGWRSSGNGACRRGFPIKRRNADMAPDGGAR